MKKLNHLLIAIVAVTTTSLGSCQKDPGLSNPTDPNNSDEPISKILAGIYSGNGKYMPADIFLGESYSCTEPNWASLLKSGVATATITSISDSTVDISLTGSIYKNGFNGKFRLSKNGNEISDDRGIVKYFIDTKSLQLGLSVIKVAMGNACLPLNKNYYVFEGPKTSPATPFIKYYSKERWEFNGNK